MTALAYYPGTSSVIKLTSLRVAYFIVRYQRARIPYTCTETFMANDIGGHKSADLSFS